MANNLLVDWLNNKKKNVQTNVLRKSATNTNNVTTPNLPIKPTTVSQTGLNLQKVQQPVQTRLNNINTQTAPIQTNTGVGSIAQTPNQSRFIGFQQQQPQAKSFNKLMNNEYLMIPTAVNQANFANAKEENRYRTAEQVIKDFAWDVKNSNGNLTKEDISKYYKEWEGNEDAALQLQVDILPLVQQGQFPDMNWVSQTYGELLKGKELKDVEKIKENIDINNKKLQQIQTNIDKTLKTNWQSLSPNGMKYIQNWNTVLKTLDEAKKQGIVGGASNAEIIDYLAKNNSEFNNIFKELNGLELSEMDKAIVGKKDASLLKQVQNKMSQILIDQVTNSEKPTDEEIESVMRGKEKLENDFWGQTGKKIATEIGVPVDSLEKFTYRTYKDIQNKILEAGMEYTKDYAKKELKSAFKEGLGVDLTDEQLNSIDNLYNKAAAPSINEQIKINKQNVMDYAESVNKEYESRKARNLDPDVENYVNNMGMTRSLLQGNLEAFGYKSAGDMAQNADMLVTTALGVVAPEVVLPLMAVDSYSRESQESFEELMETQKKMGIPQDEAYDNAQKGSVIVGLASATVELALEKLIGGVETTASKAWHDAFTKEFTKKATEMMTERGLADILKQGATTQFKASLEEGLEEVLQQTIHNKAIQQYDPDQKLTEGLLQAFEGGFYNPMNLLAGGGDVFSNIDTNSIKQGVNNTVDNATARARNIVGNVQQSVNNGVNNVRDFMNRKNKVTSQNAGGNTETQLQGEQTNISSENANKGNNTSINLQNNNIKSTNGAIELEEDTTENKKTAIKEGGLGEKVLESLNGLDENTRERIKKNPYSVEESKNLIKEMDENPGIDFRDYQNGRYEEVLDTVLKKLEQKENKRSKDIGTLYDKLEEANAPVDVTELKNKVAEFQAQAEALEDIATPAEQAQIKTILENIEKIGDGTMDVWKVRKIADKRSKRSASSSYDGIGLIWDIRDAIDDVIVKGNPDMKEVDKSYSKVLKEIGEIKGKLFYKNGGLKSNAVSTIKNMMNAGNRIDLNNLEKYIPGIKKQLQAIDDSKFVYNAYTTGKGSRFISGIARGVFGNIGKAIGFFTGGWGGLVAGAVVDAGVDTALVKLTRKALRDTITKETAASRAELERISKKIEEGEKLDAEDKARLKELGEKIKRNGEQMAKTKAEKEAWIKMMDENITPQTTEEEQEKNKVTKKKTTKKNKVTEKNNNKSDTDTTPTKPTTPTTPTTPTNTVEKNKVTNKNNKKTEVKTAKENILDEKKQVAERSHKKLNDRLADAGNRTNLSEESLDKIGDDARKLANDIYEVEKRGGQVPADMKVTLRNTYDLLEQNGVDLEYAEEGKVYTDVDEMYDETEGIELIYELSPEAEEFYNKNGYYPSNANYEIKESLDPRATKKNTSGGISYLSRGSAVVYVSVPKATTKNVVTEKAKVTEDNTNKRKPREDQTRTELLYGDLEELGEKVEDADGNLTPIADVADKFTDYVHRVGMEKSKGEYDARNIAKAIKEYFDNHKIDDFYKKEVLRDDGVYRVEISDEALTDIINRTIELETGTKGDKKVRQITGKVTQGIIEEERKNKVTAKKTEATTPKQEENQTKKFDYKDYGEFMKKYEAAEKEINDRLDKQMDKERAEKMERFNELTKKEDKTDAEGDEMMKLAGELNNMSNRYDRLKEQEFNKKHPELVAEKQRQNEMFDRDWKAVMDKKMEEINKPFNNLRDKYLKELRNELGIADDVTLDSDFYNSLTPEQKKIADEINKEYAEKYEELRQKTASIKKIEEESKTKITGNKKNKVTNPSKVKEVGLFNENEVDKGSKSEGLNPDALPLSDYREMQRLNDGKYYSLSNALGKRSLKLYMAKKIATELVGNYDEIIADEFDPDNLEDKYVEVYNDVIDMYEGYEEYSDLKNDGDTDINTLKNTLSDVNSYADKLYKGKTAKELIDQYKPEYESDLKVYNRLDKEYPGVFDNLRVDLTGAEGKARREFASQENETAQDIDYQELAERENETPQIPTIFEEDLEQMNLRGLQDNETPQDIDYQDLAELENETPQIVDVDEGVDITTQLIDEFNKLKPGEFKRIGDNREAGVRKTFGDANIKVPGEEDSVDIYFMPGDSGDRMNINLHDTSNLGIRNANEVLNKLDIPYRIGSEFDEKLNETRYYLENKLTHSKAYFDKNGASRLSVNKTLRGKEIVPRRNAEEQAEYNMQMEQRRAEIEAEREQDRIKAEERKAEEERQQEIDKQMKANLLRYVDIKHNDNPLGRGRTLKDLSEKNSEASNKVRYYGDDVADDAGVWQVLDVLADKNGKIREVWESDSKSSYSYEYYDEELGRNNNISGLNKTQRDYLEYRIKASQTEKRVNNHLDKIENKSLKTRVENKLNEMKKWQDDNGKTQYGTDAQYIDYLVLDKGFTPKEFPTGKTYANGEPKIDYMIVNEKNVGYISSKIENDYARSLLETPEEELSAEDEAKLDELFTPKTTTEVTGEKNAVTAKQAENEKPKNLVTSRIENTNQEIQEIDKDTYFDDIVKNLKDHPREMFIYKDGSYFYPHYILPSGKVITPENTYWGEVSSEEAARNWLLKEAEEHSEENETKKAEKLKEIVGKTAEKYEATLKRIESDNPMQEIWTSGDYFKYGMGNNQMARAKKESEANAEVGTFKKDVIDGKEGYRIFVAGTKNEAIRAFYDPKTGKTYRIYRGPVIDDSKPYTTKQVERIEKFLQNVDKQLDKETKKEKKEEKQVITQEWLDSLKPDKDGIIELDYKGDERWALGKGKEALIKEGKADGKYLYNYGGAAHPQYMALYIKNGEVYEGRKGLEDQYMTTKQEAVDWLNQKEKDVEHESTERYTQTDYETLPKTISVESEAEKAGPKRIAPDRVKRQQETYDQGLESVKNVLKQSPVKIYELGFKSDRSKAVQDILAERRRIRELPEAEADKQWNELAKSVYEDLVIKDISKGYRYPEDVTSKFPKAQMKKAVDARARYEKGLFTSFSAKDTRANNQYRDEIGAGIKSQDGKPVTQEQMQEIVDGIRSFSSVFGLDMKKFAEDNNIIYVHLHGGNPFLMGGGGKSRGGGMNIAGLYRRGADGNISISLGGVEMVMEKGEDGEMKKNNVNATPEHELAHAVDYMLENKLFSSQDIEILKKTMNKPTRLINYYNRSQEIVARAVEQYAASKQGKSRYGHPYIKSQGYWDQENFDKYVKPIVEKNMKEKMKDYMIQQPKNNVIANDKNKITSK